MMRPALSSGFLTVPLAHRALHDVAQGRVENSLSAVRAAIDAGYGIELDVQLSADGAALVFHDYDLMRLTGRAGPVQALTQQQARETPLTGGGGDTILSLPEILSEIAGQVPVLIEIKDQDGAMGADVGPLEQAVAKAIHGYVGEVAVMSFNPHSVAEMARLAPQVARGIVTSDYDPADWPLTEATCTRLRDIPDYDAARASFISHQHDDLQRPRVQELKQAGAAILCWTVRSPDAEAAARQIADNITFESYLAPHPA